MIARLLSSLLIASALAIVAGMAMALTSGRPLLAALMPALPFAAMALVFAVEAVMLRRAGRGDPTGVASGSVLLAALIGEMRAAVPRFFWHQAWAWSPQTRFIPAGRGADAAAVLLVHGYFCNHGFWWRWKARLERIGRPFIAVTLEPAFRDIGRTAPIIESAVAALHAATGRPVVIVAHSMGGLAVRHWWCEQPAHLHARVHRVITIGTPHQGTELARFAHTENARQMQVGSAWLQRLAEREPAERSTRFVCFHGHCDNIVFPPRRACLDGADNRHLTGVAHVAMADHPAVWAALEVTLTEADRSQQPAGPNSRSPGQASPA